MAFFNMIETFFFISLGITFVLILMLVYHFKQRLSTIETETKTMFQIVNGVVKELSGIKLTTMQLHGAMQSIYSHSNDEYDETNNINYRQHSHVLEHISEIDEDDVSDMDDSESDISDEASSSNQYYEYNQQRVEEPVENNKVCVNDEAEIVEHVIAHDDIKIVNVEITNDVDSISDNYADEPETNEEFSEVVDDSIETIEESADHTEHSDIVVNKLDIIGTIDTEPAQTSETEEKQDPKEAYKKMNIHQLRALIISHGLASDTSKIKKQDAIKMLEEFDSAKTQEPAIDVDMSEN